MKTHELELIKIVDELNDRNNKIRAYNRSKPQIEAYSWQIWEQLEVPEVTA
jgi:hypothetical protein